MKSKDDKLWELAEARVKFKGHLSTYLVVNLFLWALWYFSGNYNAEHENVFLPWPAWVSLGWGIGVLLNFVGVYINNSFTSIDREYQKLKQK